MCRRPSWAPYRALSSCRSRPRDSLVITPGFAGLRHRHLYAAVLGAGRRLGRPLPPYAIHIIAPAWWQKWCKNGLQQRLCFLPRILPRPLCRIAGAHGGKIATFRPVCKLGYRALRYSRRDPREVVAFAGRLWRISSHVTPGKRPCRKSSMVVWWLK